MVRAITLCGIGLAVMNSLAIAADLQSKLAPLIDAHHGEVAVYVNALGQDDSNESVPVAFGWQESKPMPTASLIKLAVLCEAYRQVETGRLSLEQSLVLSEQEKVPGSGVLTKHFSSGLELSLRDTLRLMIAYSDNTATNLAVDAIGIGATARTMQEWGYPNTKLHSKVYKRSTSIFPKRSEEFGLGSTTAKEVGQLLESLITHEHLSGKSCRAIIEHLDACEDRAKIPREFPAAVRFAHKTGAVSAVRCDAGILFGDSGPIVICVLTSKNEDQSWGESNEAELLCGRIGRVVYEYFGSASKGESPARLSIGAGGVLVEDLQRTLNEQLSPSPALSVDGDFGPATEAAIRRFQQVHSIVGDPPGIVGEATWAKLGTLSTANENLPPEVVNALVDEKETPDTLHGAPFVTSKSWVIADETGAAIAGKVAESPLPNASTTKLLTAWVVWQHCKEHPDALQEVVQFSKRADETIGSSSTIREGERVVVHELLYGLLLPSGNDASVALAEHFGARLKVGATDAYQAFVDVMNETASELGMSSTHFVNPHGLTEAGHVTSAQDLAILAAQILKDPELSKYVATRRRGVTVASQKGYKRNLVWNNTNRLLAIEGYNGLKTGTTDAAGACLVACGTRDGKTLIVVNLGAASSASRYTDSRNLFRYGWNLLREGK